MTQAIMSWAVESWHVVEARLALLTIARPDGPVSPLSLDPRGFLAVCEGMLRESSEDSSKNLDELYAEATPAPALSPAEAAAERRSQIARLSRLFGG